MTEITHVEHEKFFIDEQRQGPYSLWHHQHHFKETNAGVEMTDIVHYKLPLWFLGDIANTLFVRDQLNKIFDHRFKIAKELFDNTSRNANTKCLKNLFQKVTDANKSNALKKLLKALLFRMT